MVQKSAVILLAIAALLVTFRMTAAQEDAVPQVVSAEIIECPMPLAAGEIEGETIICGQIQVPENWDEPDGKLITISYARQFSRNQSPIADPIIFFAGGPGGSILASQESDSFNFDYLRTTRDVIVWDQRGTRYSTDLDCAPEVYVPDQAEAEARSEQLSADWTLESDPAEVLAVSRATVDIFGIDNCAAHLTDQGYDLLQYNTPNTVKDSIALMNHLGDPAFNLFGISYGTQVALEIMEYYENHPEAELPELRSALLDGVFPRNLDSAEDSLVGAYNILRVFDNCEADAGCAAAYPDIRARLIDLLAELEEKPLETADGADITLADVQTILFQALPGRRYELVPYLPRLVDELTRGETAAYDALTGIISGDLSATRPEAEVPVTSPLDPLTREAAALAEQLRTIAGQMDALGASTDNLAAAIDAAETLPELYISILEHYLQTSTTSVRGGFASTLLDQVVPYPENRTRETLSDLQGLLPAVVGNELDAVLNLMSEEDVAEVWEQILVVSELQKSVAIGTFTNSVVKCNDRASEYNIDHAFDVYRAFEAPQLIGDLKIVADYFSQCEIFGSAVPEFSLLPPVKSDLRTLVMNGDVDHATPNEWAKLAFETLTNAELVLVPMHDHGATRDSKCAKDIAHTFFLYPDSVLDTSCIEEFRIEFVLPDETLPGA